MRRFERNTERSLASTAAVPGRADPCGCRATTTAATLLAATGGRSSVGRSGAAQRGLADADPLVRLAGLRTLGPLLVEQSWQLTRGLLDDPVRGVRLEA